MKQPELGKKILELRKEKGWTQEELVEKCNLNVRTIQRIEAGNVTPRSFTIKALFHALDYRYEESESEFLQENQKDLAYLYVAFACGFIYFFLVFFEINLDFNWLESEEKVDSKTLLVFKTATFLMYIGFILGWLKCEFFLPNQVLKIACWTMLGINIFWYSMDFYALLFEQISMMGYYLIKSSSFGLGYAFLGIGYLGYKDLWSNIPQIIGVFGAIAGILIFSGIGIFFGLIPWTFFELGQLVLMIWVINQKVRGSSEVYY